MKNLFIRILVLLPILAPPAFAQLQFGGKFAHNRYVQFEPVIAELTVVNKTGKTLLIGETGGETFIRFEIRDAGGAYIQPRPEQTQVTMLVGAGQTATASVNVRDYYRLDKPGAYTIVPMLVTASRTYLAPKAFLDVVSGVVAAEMDLDVDGSTRHYSLLMCSRDRHDDLFLRIDDPEKGFCYGVQALGNVLRFQPPHMEVDEEDRLHVIHQAHPAYLTHHVFSLDGSLIRRASFNRNGATELLDDEDHLELMADEAAEAGPVPPQAPVDSQPGAAEVVEPVDPVRSAERAEVDAIMEDLDSMAVAVPDPLPVAVQTPAVAAPPEPVEQQMESAPESRDPLYQPVGR